MEMLQEALLVMKGNLTFPPTAGNEPDVLFPISTDIHIRSELCTAVEVGNYQLITSNS